MKFRHTAALAVALACLASEAMADVRLSIHDGHVSLSATNATVPQILAEWAKVGRTKVVNGDRASGPPMALELTNVPEAEALQIILRSVSGYLLAPRSVTAPDASTYDRILIIPATRAVSPASPVQAAPSPGPSQPTFAQQLFGPRRSEDNGEAPPDQAQPVRPPPFNFPQPANGVAPPQNAAPAAPPAPSTAPVVPGGVPFPGMLPPPPPASPQNGQPQNGQGRQQP